MTREILYLAGLSLMNRFCKENNISPPIVKRLGAKDRLYHLATCAFYRPTTIHIMVEKCALPGHGGRAWSWPGYAIDRTPYGVIQHELGHHVENYFSADGNLFSHAIWRDSQEAPLTGYLGTDKKTATFYMEWFAENFRLFVTNPSLSQSLRPKFCKAIARRGVKPVINEGWRDALATWNAPERITSQAQKKINNANPLLA